MNQDELKRAAAKAAMEYVRDGMTLGVGTGSTVNHFIDMLGQYQPRLQAVVSSSEASTERLRKAGIDVVELSSTNDLDLYVDGADEANKHGHLIKGGGGALTREKIVAAASRRFVCIIDDSKLKGVLGAFPLPVEVIPMARAWVSRQMVKAGGRPEWRKDFVTDNGNDIIDVHNLDILNPIDMERRFNQLPGVVTVGLFAQRPANVLLIASATGVRRLEP